MLPTTWCRPTSAASPPTRIWRTWSTGEQCAPPVVLDDLRRLPDGSFGPAYCDWLVANDLDPEIASTFRCWHLELAAAGELDDMPEPVRHTVVRLFQTHDFQHVVTGYGSCPQGEIAIFPFRWLRSGSPTSRRGWRPSAPTTASCNRS